MAVDQQWEGPGEPSDQVRAAMARTAVELVCQACDWSWETHAAGGHTVRCPGCGHPVRVSVRARDARGTSAGRRRDVPGTPVRRPGPSPLPAPSRVVLPRDVPPPLPPPPVPSRAVPATPRRTPGTPVRRPAAPAARARPPRDVERPISVMPPVPTGVAGRALWGLEALARISAGQRVVTHEQMGSVRERVDQEAADRSAARLAADQEAAEREAARPPRITPGSPYAVGPMADRVLAGWYGLPPASGRDSAGTCAMRWREIGRTDGPTRVCNAAAEYVADLGYHARGGSSLPVCSAHAHQLVTVHGDHPERPRPVMRSLRGGSGAGFGIPAEYLGDPL